MSGRPAELPLREPAGPPDNGTMRSLVTLLLLLVVACTTAGCGMDGTAGTYAGGEAVYVKPSPSTRIP